MSKNITRSDLATAVYQNIGLSFSESERMVDEVFEEITQAFERNEDVKISSFATFSLKQKNSRMGRNPKNGKPYEITARRILSFAPSQTLKAVVDKKGRK